MHKTYRTYVAVSSRVFTRWKQRPQRFQDLKREIIVYTRARRKVSKMFTKQFVIFLFAITLADITVYAFEFIRSPVDTTCIEGGIAILNCRVGADANGDGPPSSYWVRHKNSAQIPISENNDTSKYAYFHGDLANRITVFGDFKYEYNMRISNVQLADTGSYQCWHLDAHGFGHYSDLAYLRVLPRDVAAWFPSCSVGNPSSVSGAGATVGSTVWYICQTPIGVTLPRDLSMYVKTTNNVTIAICENVPCSFTYTLRLTDRNDRFVCGTTINNETIERNCTVNQLRERSEVSILSEPTPLVQNAVGSLYCNTADENEEYLYQWFLGDRPLTEPQVDIHYTFPFLSETFNKAEVSCVVSDQQGYVGSDTIVIVFPAMTGDSATTTKSSEDAAVITKPPLEQSAMENIFGIPMEVLLFFSSAIVVLLLILIIIILLIQRQKKTRVEQLNATHTSELVAIGNAELKLDLSNDVIIAPHKQHALSQSFSKVDNPSFYDNVPSSHRYTSEPCSRPYNSNNAKDLACCQTAGHASVNASMQITEYTKVGSSDYNVLDPSVVSDDDTLDSFELDDMRETSQRNFEREMKTPQSIVTRQRSLPVDPPSALYAVTSLVNRSDLGRHSVSNLPRDRHKESVSIRQRSASCQDQPSEYASPCNRPKSRDFSLSETSGSDDVIVTSFPETSDEIDPAIDLRHEISKHGLISDVYGKERDATRSASSRVRTKSSHSDRTDDDVEGNVIRLERSTDGTERSLVLDDNKYITHTICPKSNGILGKDNCS